MAGDSSEEDRTEEPTARRLERAREDGEAARSTEMPAAAVVIAAASVMVLWGGTLASDLKSTFAAGFVFDRKTLSSVEMIPAYRWGWSYISHFIHSRFYCYSYTFAELLVLALFQKYRLDGDSFKPGYRELLESGGSLSPADTARLAGIDINARDFWQNGYDFLEGLIEELRVIA